MRQKLTFLGISMIEIELCPPYFATLYSSIVASCKINQGRELSKSDMFSNKVFFSRLARYYMGWKEKSGFNLSPNNEKIVLNAMGGYFPWINTLAGHLHPNNQDNQDLDDLFEELMF